MKTTGRGQNKTALGGPVQNSADVRIFEPGRLVHPDRESMEKRFALWRAARDAGMHKSKYDMDNYYFGARDGVSMRAALQLIGTLPKYEV